jgi:hypothetical protein
MEHAAPVGKAIKKIMGLAKTMASNRDEGVSLALRVQAIERPLRERAAASKAAHDMVMHDLNRIATFLAKFGPDQPWGKQISNGLGADGDKANFQKYRDILNDMITDVEFVRAHAAEQRKPGAAIEQAAAPRAPYANTPSPCLGTSGELYVHCVVPMCVKRA